MDAFDELERMALNATNDSSASIDEEASNEEIEKW